MEALKDPSKEDFVETGSFDDDVWSYVAVDTQTLPKHRCYWTLNSEKYKNASKGKYENVLSGEDKDLTEYLQRWTPSTEEAQYIQLTIKDRDVFASQYQAEAGKTLKQIPSEIYVYREFFGKRGPWSLDNAEGHNTRSATDAHKKSIPETGIVTQGTKKQYCWPIRDENGSANILRIINENVDNIGNEGYSYTKWGERGCDRTVGTWHGSRSANPDEIKNVWIRPSSGTYRLKEGFRSVVNAFNSVEPPPMSGSHITYDVADTIQNGMDYIFFSENPFQLYHTWLHYKEFQKYLETHPIRQLPAKPQRVEAKNTVKAPTTIRKMLSESQDKLTNQPGFMFSHKGIIATITSDKIGAARKARKLPEVRRLGQSHMMGSAPQIARNDFKWEAEDQGTVLKNGLHMAEWLHLLAFSWGGFPETPMAKLLNEEEVNKYLEGNTCVTKSSTSVRSYITSQVPLNLMFGTSECNSAMCRYEKAWQKLFTQEDSLQKKTVEGILTVTPSEKLDIPIETKTLVQMEEAKAKGGNIFEWKTQGECYEKQKYVGKPWEDQRSLFEWFKLGVEYKVELKGDSKILGGNNPSCEVAFYPFTRFFYLKAEEKVDEILLKVLVKQALDGHKTSKDSRPLKSLPNLGSPMLIGSFESKASSPGMASPASKNPNQIEEEHKSNYSPRSKSSKASSPGKTSPASQMEEEHKSDDPPPRSRMRYDRSQPKTGPQVRSAGLKAKIMYKAKGPDSPKNSDGLKNSDRSKSLDSSKSISSSKSPELKKTVKPGK